MEPVLIFTSGDRNPKSNRPNDRFAGHGRLARVVSNAVDWSNVWVCKSSRTDSDIPLKFIVPLNRLSGAVLRYGSLCSFHQYGFHVKLSNRKLGSQIRSWVLFLTIEVTGNSLNLLNNLERLYVVTAKEIPSLEMMVLISSNRRNVTQDDIPFRRTWSSWITNPPSRRSWLVAREPATCKVRLVQVFFDEVGTRGRPAMGFKTLFDFVKLFSFLLPRRSVPQIQLITRGFVFPTHLPPSPYMLTVKHSAKEKKPLVAMNLPLLPASGVYDLRNTSYILPSCVARVEDKEREREKDVWWGKVVISHAWIFVLLRSVFDDEGMLFLRDVRVRLRYYQ